MALRRNRVESPGCLTPGCRRHKRQSEKPMPRSPERQPDQPLLAARPRLQANGATQFQLGRGPLQKSAADSRQRTHQAAELVFRVEAEGELAIVQ
jgi:hypothetical protein